MSICPRPEESKRTSSKKEGSMAPEFPPRLVVFTLEPVGDSLAALIENVELNEATLGDGQ
jgi:hypothetical protein